jgi:peptidoglycan/LPS O-acetylase OafA/YrhL
MMLSPPPARDGDRDFREAEHYPVFDVMRIVAGLMVIYSHSFVLVGRPEPLIDSLGSYDVTVGHAGVAVFFVLSGWLITRSWVLQPSAMPYMMKRFVRIWPAYTLVVVVAALLVGPLVTDLALLEYLSDKQTWVYIGRTLIMSPVEFDLPGVFTDQPSAAVNGSLWTLPYEVFAYLALLGMGAIGLLGRRLLVVVLTGLFLVGVRLTIQDRSIDFDVAANGINALAAVNLGAWFLLGSCLYLLRDRLRWTWVVAAGVAAVGGVGVVRGESLLVLPATAYLLIYLGSRPWSFVDVIRRPGDPSYGIYLFAFPVQQILVWSGIVGNSPWALLSLASPLAILLGYLSWRIVEKPAMQTMRGRIRRSSGLPSVRPATAE